MQDDSASSQYLSNDMLLEKPHIPLNHDSFNDQQVDRFTFSSPEISEKKLDLLKRLLLLQKKKSFTEIGDPSFLLDENFELSPGNYSNLLDYTKMTAEKLNNLITESSQIFSSYLNGFNKLEPTDKCDDDFSYMQSPSLDSNSTRDSEQFSDSCQSIPSFNSLPSGNCTPKHSTQSREFLSISKGWDSEKDKLLIKFVCRFNKDWKKVCEALFNTYQARYKIDFLKERYRQLYYSKQKLNQYTQKSNNPYLEQKNSLNEMTAMNNYQNCKRSSGMFKQKRVEVTRKHLFEDLLEAESPAESNPPKHIPQTDTASFHLFYTKDHQLTSKTVDVPWISFDFDTEFGAEEQLYERVTPCHY
jgi:hypothetical protein